MPESWGERLFTAGTYRRVAFAPWLFAFVWGAAIRVGVSDQYSPIPFVGSHDIANIWTVLALGCPPLALVAWWLIDHAKWEKATFAGIWLRLTADIGLFSVLLTYHISVVTNNRPPTESRIFSRYIVGACVMFTLMLVARDMWVIRRTEKMARKIRNG